MIDVDFFEEAATEQGGLSVVVLDEQPELTEVEVEERIERLHELNAQVEAERARCEAFKSHYRAKIIQAEKNFETDTEELRAEIDSIMALLHRYAVANITGKAKHLKFPSGKLKLTKQSPLFFIGGVAVVNDNPQLIEVARNIDADLIKTEEIARWGELKKRLTVDDDGRVYLKDTGEIIPDLRAKIIPDEFTVTKN